MVEQCFENFDLDRYSPYIFSVKLSAEEFAQKRSVYLVC